MTTKTNLQHTSNSYNGGTMERDSPAALLDMLAEVASQTLHSEKKRIKSLLEPQCKPKTAILKQKESCFTVPQLLSMPVSHLVKQFSIFTSDELKRQYSYTCALIPECRQKYNSFASEGKARISIKNHLIEHLENLKADTEAYNTFTAKGVNHKNLKSNMQNKKSRTQPTKKPQEALNKENKNVILEKSTNYLRKILLNDVSFKEIDKQKGFQKSGSKDPQKSEIRSSEQVDIRVLGDHSYFERLDDKIPNRKEMTSLNNVLDNSMVEENIVLMVVGTDGVQMKEYSHVNQRLSETVDRQNPDSLYLPDLSQSTESRAKNTEVSITTKPKGKAKFIGTSKEERELALAYMDRIKKKGNPTGSNLQCRICDPPRSFTAPTTLVSHYRSHAGIKPYECRICRAVFTRRHSLKYHMLIHQNQTRFTCTDCGKKFRHPSHFREHQRRHTGEAPFGCDDCGQRFKTRNTYKRHLKTRHGKILTTTGELLHLSEEDFQKVRTTRRKKDYAPETTVNVDNIASNVIINFKDQQMNERKVITNSMKEYVLNSQYILKENIGDVNKNWEIKDTIQIVDKCFENVEIPTQSHLNKTDDIETEIAIDSRYPNRDDNSIKLKCVDNVQDDLLQSKDAFYENLKVIDNEENSILYQHNITDPDKVYDCNNEMQSYHEVNYNNEILRKKINDKTEHETSTDFSEQQNVTELRALQESTTNSYHKIIYNNETQNKSMMYMHLNAGQTKVTSSNEINQTNEERYNMNVITMQNNIMDLESGEYVNSLNDETKKECVGDNVTFCTDIADVHINPVQTFNKTENEIISQNQNNILQIKEQVNECNFTDSIEQTGNIDISLNHSAHMSQKLDQSDKQYLYIHTESLNNMITPNKCIKILPHQINLYRDQQNQLKTTATKCKKIKVLNKDIQAINIKQCEQQNAVFLLTSDTLKNNILQIDRNSIMLKGLKR